MTLSKDVADKILALLRKAESTTSEHEERAFRKKAVELMEKYDATTDDLKRDALSKKIHDTKWKNTPGWAKVLAGGLKDFLGIFMLYQSGTFFLYGEERDLELFSYMHDALINQTDQLAHEYYHRVKKQTGDNPGRRRMNAYRVGVAENVYRRLQKMVEDVSGEKRSGPGLVLRDRIQEKIRRAKDKAREDGQRWRKGSGTTHSSTEGYRDGQQDGGKVNVHRGATAGKSRRLSA